MHLQKSPILSRQVTQNTEIQWSSCSLVPSSSAVRPKSIRPDVIPQPASRDVTQTAAASASCFIPETARHQDHQGPCSHPSRQPHQQHHTRLIAGWQINWPRRRSYTCLKGRPWTRERFQTNTSWYLTGIDCDNFQEYLWQLDHKHNNRWDKDWLIYKYIYGHLIAFAYVNVRKSKYLKMRKGQAKEVRKCSWNVFNTS